MGKKEAIEEIESQESRIKLEILGHIAVILFGIFLFFVPFFITWLLGFIFIIGSGVGYARCKRRSDNLRIEKAKLI